MGEMLWDLMFDDTNEYGLPPGFRFHPTDDELVTFYLASKVYNGGGCGVDIVEVDLNRCEPWELPDRAKMGEREWYFYTLKDRKYPTGLRTNRATVAGYWKATGKDREVYSAFNGSLVGLKKTLVFYRGRAPRGEKTKWILHEYRLDGDFSSQYTFKEEWVICRVIHKEGLEKKKNTYIQDNYFPAEASSSSISFQTSPIQTFLQQSNYYTYHFNNNNNNNNSHGLLSSVDTILPEPYSPANITSHLKSQSNHFPLMETIPVPQQCNVPPTHVQDQFLNWVENSNPNPFGFDVGLFDSSFSCGAVYDTPLMLPLQGGSLLM